MEEREREKEGRMDGTRERKREEWKERERERELEGKMENIMRVIRGKIRYAKVETHKMVVGNTLGLVTHYQVMHTMFIHSYLCHFRDGNRIIILNVLL